MNRRFISVLMFAFIVAGGASVALYRLVMGKMHVNAAAQTTSIIVATKQLELGAVLTAADVHIADWPGALPQGAVTKIADAVGRGVIAPIYLNEPVTEGRLGARGAGGGLAVTIPSGMRAVAIRVNEVVGVAGFVVAGTHVDVLVSGNPPSSTGVSGGSITRTLLQNISVLSAGQDFKRDTEGKPVTVQVVNLLVTPPQAEILSMAGNQMTIQLVLRNPLDTAIEATPGVTLTNIFAGQSNDVPNKPALVHEPAAHRHAPVATLAVDAPITVHETPHIEVIAGSKRTEVQVPVLEQR
jgi:pilus assembly protein CpaB